MSKVQDRGESVRRFIIGNVEKYPGNIAKVAAERFGITRQAVNKHLQKLVAEQALVQDGETRSRVYGLASLLKMHKNYALTANLAEDKVWREDVAPLLGKMPRNVTDIWQYGFTEMLNNAIDHSEGTTLHIEIKKNAGTTEVAIFDNGVGIFKKIQAALGLLDERHAVLELAKGKFTTDPSRHSGEGIFFASRMFDDFGILSGGIHFSHEFDEKEDWILEQARPSRGTVVRMMLNNHTSRTTKKVFDSFASGEDYGFTKTVVPVKLAQYGDDNLVSRSQAKRLLARVEKFKTVVLDFRGVEMVGQAFADEVFRVFSLKHPEVVLVELNANAAVKRMVSRARAHSG
ncbi:MAG: STAS-like domain-containing protein [Burkholderiales bacterium]